MPLSSVRDTGCHPRLQSRLSVRCARSLFRPRVPPHDAWYADGSADLTEPLRRLQGGSPSYRVCPAGGSEQPAGTSTYAGHLTHGNV